METLTTRNKAEARRIESWVQRQIADLGTARIAEVAGINKSTVSRWRENLVPNMSLLLAILIMALAGNRQRQRMIIYTDCDLITALRQCFEAVLAQPANQQVSDLLLRSAAAVRFSLMLAVRRKL